MCILFTTNESQIKNNFTIFLTVSYNELPNDARISNYNNVLNKTL